MKQLPGALRMQANIAASGKAVKRLGTVDGYDQNSYSVSVVIEPEGIKTGFIPLVSPWIGNLWGLYLPPSIGDMIEVTFIEDDPASAVAGMRFFNDVDQPLSCPSGEFWLVHKSGSFLKFHNDGSIEVHAAGNLNATVAGNAVATIQGSAQVTANGGVTIDGAGAGNTKGVVQGDCICSFTGQPHAMISGNVKGSL